METKEQQPQFTNKSSFIASFTCRKTNGTIYGFVNHHPGSNDPGYEKFIKERLFNENLHMETTIGKVTFETISIEKKEMENDPKRWVIKWKSRMKNENNDYIMVPMKTLENIVLPYMGALFRHFDIYGTVDHEAASRALEQEK